MKQDTAKQKKTLKHGLSHSHLCPVLAAICTRYYPHTKALIEYVSTHVKLTTCELKGAEMGQEMS